MKNFNLLQIIPSLDSGGAEQGTVDLANFIGEKNLGSFIVSNGIGCLLFDLLLNHNRNIPINNITIQILSFVLIPKLTKFF